MTEVVARGAVEPTLRARGPAYSVMQECLRIQSEALPLGKVAHFFGCSPLCADARSWYRGALGELEVAAELARLGPDFVSVTCPLDTLFVSTEVTTLTVDGAAAGAVPGTELADFRTRYPSVPATRTSTTLLSARLASTRSTRRTILEKRSGSVGIRSW